MGCLSELVGGLIHLWFLLLHAKIFAHWGYFFNSRGHSFLIHKNLENVLFTISFKIPFPSEHLGGSVG